MIGKCHYNKKELNVPSPIRSLHICVFGDAVNSVSKMLVNFEINGQLICIWVKKRLEVSATVTLGSFLWLDWVHTGSTQSVRVAKKCLGSVWLHWYWPATGSVNSFNYLPQAPWPGYNKNIFTFCARTAVNATSQIIPYLKAKRLKQFSVDLCGRARSSLVEAGGRVCGNSQRSCRLGVLTLELVIYHGLHQEANNHIQLDKNVKHGCAAPSTKYKLFSQPSFQFLLCTKKIVELRKLQSQNLNPLEAAGCSRED